MSPKTSSDTAKAGATPPANPFNTASAPTPDAGAPIMPPTGPKKSKTGLIIGIVAGAVVLVGGLVALTLFLVLGGGIKTPEDFLAAVNEQRALNCEVTAEGQTARIQADDGWEKVYIVSDQDGSHNEALLIRGDAIYAWNDGDLAVKVAYTESDYNDFVETVTDLTVTDLEFDEDDEEDGTIDCTSLNNADFEVPNKDWSEANDVDITDNGGGDNGGGSSAGGGSSTGGVLYSYDFSSAVINDTESGLRFSASDVVYDAFPVTQAMIDDFVVSEGEVFVAVRITASRTSDSPAIAGIYDLDFIDGNGDVIFVSSNSLIKDAAADAGYTMVRDFASLDRGETDEDWVVFAVDPSVTTRFDLQMQYERPDYEELGSDTIVIPARTFTEFLL